MKGATRGRKSGKGSEDEVERSRSPPGGRCTWRRIAIVQAWGGGTVGLGRPVIPVPVQNPMQVRDSVMGSRTAHL
eukprot:11460196-Alexandrium_andersonii.AAC.1